MGRKSKACIIEENSKVLGVRFKCGFCKKISTIKVDGHDFSSSESDCELCGSHGSVSVDLKCPKCGYQHLDFELNGW